MLIRTRSGEAAQPPSQGLAIMPLAAQGVVAAETMVDVGNAVFQQRVEVPLVDSLEVLLGNSFDDCVVHVLASAVGPCGL